MYSLFVIEPGSVSGRHGGLRTSIMKVRRRAVMDFHLFYTAAKGKWGLQLFQKGNRSGTNFFDLGHTGVVGLGIVPDDICNNLKTKQR
jgi:hypothetical protein